MKTEGEDEETLRNFGYRLRSQHFEVCGASLEHQGYRVTTAAGVAPAAAALRWISYDLVITDYRLKGQEDFSIYNALKEHNPNTKVIILTAHHDANAVVQALRFGADDYIFKPYDITELWERVGLHLQETATESQAATVPNQFPALDEEILKMLWIMTHDIKDSLTSMTATLAYLHQGAYGSINDGASRKLNELYCRAKRLIGMTEDFMGKAASVNGEVSIEREEMDLRGMVDPVLMSSVRSYARAIHIDNQLDMMRPTIFPWWAIEPGSGQCFAISLRTPSATEARGVPWPSALRMTMRSSDSTSSTVVFLYR
jgi:CheY-like chemotaxis protein